MANKDSWSKQTEGEDYPIGRRVFQPWLKRTPGVTPSPAEIKDLLNKFIDESQRKQTEGGDNNGGSESKE